VTFLIYMHYLKSFPYDSAFCDKLPQDMITLFSIFAGKTQGHFISLACLSCDVYDYKYVYAKKKCLNL
jgi:hypothetical protein